MKILTIQENIIANLVQMYHFELGKRREILSKIEVDYFYLSWQKSIIKKLKQDPDIDLPLLCKTVEGAFYYITRILPYHFLIVNWKATIDELISDYQVYVGKQAAHEALDKKATGNIIERMASTLAHGLRVSIRDLGLLKEARKKYDESKDALYIPTPLSKLNSVSRGIGPGQVWVVGAGSGVGKSYYALNQAIHSALAGFKVLFFSTELSKEENFRRAVLIFQEMADIPDFEIAKDLILDMDNLRIYSDIRDVNGIESEVKRVRDDGGVDLVVIDHIHDLDTQGMRQYEAISFICDNILRFTIELGIRTLVISQLNRGGYSDTTNFTFLGSGKIEQIAHVAAIIYSEDGNRYFAIIKNRSGSQIRFLVKFEFPAGLIFSPENA